MRTLLKIFAILAFSITVSACTLVTKQVDGLVEQHLTLSVSSFPPSASHVSVIDETFFGVNISSESFRLGIGKKSQVSLGKTACAIVLIFDQLPALEPEWLTLLRAQKSSDICVVNQRGEK
jgi:hypothetical protein